MIAAIADVRHHCSVSRWDLARERDGAAEGQERL